jgi:hypothetical protein
VRYTPKDEYTATFAGAKSSSGAAFFPSTSDIQTAIINTYNFFNGITVQQQGSSLVTTVPLPADGTWFAYATTTNDIQYSPDNGPRGSPHRTWIAPRFGFAQAKYC